MVKQLRQRTSTLKTASLLRPREPYEWSHVTLENKPWLLHNPEPKIVGHPQTGYADVYDRSGHFYSKRTWRKISRMSVEYRYASVKLSDIHCPDRAFRYQPKIHWHDNPAYWDEIERSQ